ncbi:MAG: DUF3887 domain-containing protein [Bacteroidales bacterium]|jgi:hypothetical protein|nr:DUF3887 domain-containing protein [Bacteroidales bacterium]
MKIKWVINPFERIAGWQALIIGATVMAITAVVGKINHISFDGALDVHLGVTYSFLEVFVMQAVDFLTLFSGMWLAGVIFSRSRIRIIDVAGTVSLARAPMLLLVMICFLPVIPDSMFDIPHLIIFILVTIPLYIWMIALMYHAYSVSCHLKSGRAVISFIGALLVAEVASKVILYLLLTGSFTNLSASGTSGTDSTENAVVVTDSLTIRQKTGKVVHAFERGDFDAVTVYFDAAMKKALPPGGLKMAWLQANLLYGKFEKADLAGLKESSIGKHEIIEVPFTFQKAELNLRLVFNEDGSIGGLFIKPAE